MKNKGVIWKKINDKSGIIRYEAEIEGMKIGIVFGSCWRCYCDELNISEETNTHFSKGDDTIGVTQNIIEKKLNIMVDNYTKMLGKKLPKISCQLNICCGDINIHDEKHKLLNLIKKDGDKIIKTELQKRIKKYQKILSKLQCGYVVKQK